MRIWRGSLIVLLAAFAAGQGKQSFTGVITDSMCATANHAQMRMGPTDPECVIACVRAHDAVYVLYTGKEAFDLSDQKMPEKFAGKKVTVTGTVDAKTKTIKVEAMAEAK